MALTSDEFIERRIAIGLIVSTEYLRLVHRFWKPDFLTSPELTRIATWCLDFFNQYDRAPNRDIEGLYFAAIKRDELSRSDAELIEEVLNRISDDYDRSELFNVAYLYDQTVSYFREREIKRHKDVIDDLVERGRVEEAEKLATSFVPSSLAASRGLEVGSEEGYERIINAFADAAAPVITYPGALGNMLNSHLVRDGFIAFLAPEKRGKTWLMLDLAFRALRHKANVAFFQAGDLSEGQMLRRLAIHLARRSDSEESCKAYWKPVGDCLYNQFNVCTRSDRNCDFGPFDEGLEPIKGRRFPTLPIDEEPGKYRKFENIVKAAETFPDYQPCSSRACPIRRAGVWLERVPEKHPLLGPSASKVVRKFFDRYRRRFRLATYASDTLTTQEITSCLNEWERQDDFVPDVIVIDYADLMSAASISEFRHRQDAIWKGLRGISQQRHALVVTATQADADSYKTKTLRMTNFSEDKRKYAHVTAMFGLNQTPDGSEKEMGILRVNTLVAREGAYSVSAEVVVLQDLRSGRPFLESYLPENAS